MINDISGGDADDKMFPTVGKLKCAVYSYAYEGNPRTMQNNPVYEDIVADILKWFGDRIFQLRSSGVKGYNN